MMLQLFSLYMTYTGLSSFALAMDKHHVQAFGERVGPGRTRWLRLSGSILLLMALGLWVWSLDVAMGLVSWLLWVLPIMGLIVAAGLAFVPRFTATVACRRP